MAKIKRTIKKNLKKTSKKKAKNFLVKKKIKKVLKKKIVKAKKWMKKRNVTVENVFFGILVFFSLTFGVSVWGISQDLSREPVNNISQATISPMENKVRGLTKGHPMERMAPFIANKDKEVAKYLVAIAKKESNWGEFSPQKEGKDCFNYWGYRGSYNQTDSGYSCFDSPRQAVNVVGNRIRELLAQDIQTPADMIVWKCGASCAGHGDENVQKWITDVDYYYQQL